MATKAYELLKYMQANPDLELTVEDIRNFMECSYNHALNFAKRPDCVEVVPGARPIVVKYNSERATKLQEKKSVNRQFREAADSLSPSSNGSGARAVPTAPAIPSAWSPAFQQQ